MASVNKNSRKPFLLLGYKLMKTNNSDEIDDNDMDIAQGMAMLSGCLVLFLVVIVVIAVILVRKYLCL